MESKPHVGVIIGALLVIALVIGGVFLLQKPKGKSVQTTKQGAKAVHETTADGLQIDDETVGTGAEAKSGNHVTVNYLGTLTDGTKFDSSYDRNQPFDFDLGAGNVIKGWDQGVVGMRVGGKRKLTIPSSLGYGAQGAGTSIPPNATLIFEVELLGVK